MEGEKIGFPENPVTAGLTTLAKRRSMKKIGTNNYKVRQREQKKMMKEPEDRHERCICAKDFAFQDCLLLDSEARNTSLALLFHHHHASDSDSNSGLHPPNNCSLIFTFSLTSTIPIRLYLYLSLQLQILLNTLQHSWD
ncbi:uncharacterized protein G2W53_034874 [Senna tora]|uniref:Uncharacterized protein n=1 Tax=Senna tora TaxID=362788 RepID=A0A834T2D5_9FABA|nr:uncharacterized protein G2W53_034874 [Senna tora]